ncbi:hypothetical protein [Thioclava sp. GXIMD2076]|uniref:hypothetical protein n=1 Tax=Thioclava sp. GXIMD2076 TaxID=3131931 RepID=UPI0030CC9BE1
MTRNTSSAVMQQRTEPHESLDDFPTPPWATRALCDWLLSIGQDLGSMACHEPAANRGHMVRPLREAFEFVKGSDVHDYDVGFLVEDYLFYPANPYLFDWTITNPPFRLAEQFILKALTQSRAGVAVIVRSAFLEGVGRHTRLFSLYPPTDILQFTERVVMHKGKLSENGSTATAYCWIVWRKDIAGEPTRFHWIAPCRRRLERKEDYQEKEE